MVEAVVAIPFFIIIFAAAMFVGKLYTSKITTMRVARDQAWEKAVAGCGDAENNDDPPITQRNDVNPPPTFKAQNRDVSKAPAATVASKRFGDATGSAETTIVAGKVMGGQAKNVKSVIIVPCNEQTQNDDIGSTLGFVWGLASSGFKDDVKTAEDNAAKQSPSKPASSTGKTNHPGPGTHKGTQKGGGGDL